MHAQAPKSSSWLYAAALITITHHTHSSQALECLSFLIWVGLKEPVTDVALQLEAFCLVGLQGIFLSQILGPSHLLVTGVVSDYVQLCLTSRVSSVPSFY
jgi:hypothetical protein